MNRLERNAYMERMGDDFVKTVVRVARGRKAKLDDLFIKPIGHVVCNPFLDAVAIELNETQEFDGANYELKDITPGKVEQLIHHKEADIRRVWQARR